MFLNTFIQAISLKQISHESSKYKALLGSLQEQALEYYQLTYARATKPSQKTTFKLFQKNNRILITRKFSFTF